MLEASGEMACVFIQEGLDADALAATTAVRDIARQDTNYHRRLLLRRAKENLEQIQRMLASGSELSGSVSLQKTVAGYLHEVDGDLGKMGRIGRNYGIVGKVVTLFRDFRHRLDPRIRKMFSKKRGTA
jgi:hypothetical protein